jgi:hypothetical protein
MSLANIGRYQRALDDASGVILTAMGLLLTASIAFVGL